MPKVQPVSTGGQAMNTMHDTDNLMHLFENGKSLLKFVDKKLPFVRSREARDSESRIDKHNDGFSYNEDACQSMNISRLCYKSFTGSFGSSDVYSDIASIDKELMKKYFLEYLNKHKDDILREMGDMMLADAKNLKSKALAEIDGILQNIQNLFAEGDEKDNV